jgi:hypothetical protein
MLTEPTVYACITIATVLNVRDDLRYQGQMWPRESLGGFAHAELEEAVDGLDDDAYTALMKKADQHADKVYATARTAIIAEADSPRHAYLRHCALTYALLGPFSEFVGDAPPLAAARRALGDELAGERVATTELRQLAADLMTPKT